MSSSSPPAESLLQLDQVVYATPDGHTVLDGVSLDVRRGDFALIAGASGAGKSTILRLLAAFLRPTSGRVLVAGSDISRLKRSLVPTLRRQLGIVEQDPGWIAQLNLQDNVMLPVLLAGLDRSTAEERTALALAHVGLHRMVHRQPRSLSGGEQQKAALARAIVRRPSILLVDEPTAHLDAAGAHEVNELLGRFSTGGVSILMATHGDSPRPAAATAVWRLDGGKLAQA